MDGDEFTARMPIKPTTLVSVKAAAKSKGMYASFFADQCLAREAEKILAKNARPVASGVHNRISG